MFLDLCLLIDVERLKQGVDVLAYMVKFPNEIVNILRGGELVSFYYLCYSNSFLNSLIITQLSHVTRRPNFLYWIGYPDPRASPRRRQSS